jgi:glycosyltransferase involved in cell wall biosynthesis
MKIGIDCRLSGISHAGIGRYIENLISRLPQEAPGIEWVYFYRTPDQILKNLDVKYVKAPVRHYTLQEQTQLVSIYNQEKLDLLHVPHFNVPIMYPGKLVVTIHDLLWHEQRGSHVTTLKPWQYWGKYVGYKLVASTAVRKAAQILVPTRIIKQTLSEYYPVAKNKTVVTYEGVDDRLLKFKDKKIKKEEKSLIYVGSLYPHKNISLVLKALKDLPDWKLTIVGSRNVFQDQVKKETAKLGIENRVEFTGYLDDEKLAGRIKATTVLVQPSLSEGFGLTGIEAMALGTTVLASDIPVFKEIYQDAAVYFEPSSTQSFIEALDKKKPSLEKMKKVVEKYSWDEMTKQTVKVYRSLL